MTSLRRLWGFLAVDFTALSRDRMALFFTLVLPIAFVFGVGIVTGGSESRRLPIGVVDADGSEQSGRLVDRLDADESLSVTVLADTASLQEQVGQGRFAAGLVLPGGYGRALAAGDPVTLTLFEGGLGAAQVAQATVGSVVSEQAAEMSAVRFAVAAGGDASAAADAAVALAPAVATSTTVDVQAVSSTAVYQPGFTGAAYTILILFMTITALTSAGTIAERKEQGVAQRSLVTPATRSELVLGFTVARFVLLLATAVVLVVATRLLFGVRWGDLAAVAAVVVVYSAVCVGLVVVVGTLYRTSSQAGSVGPWVGIVMGMLGGCMWPLAIVPPFMRVVGHLFPTAWGVDALRIVVLGGGGIDDILLQLAVLVAFAAVLLGVGATRLRASMTRG